MTALEVCLGVGLVVAVIVVLMLAVTLPRRVALLVAAEQAKGDTRALAVKAALHEASATEVAVIVAPLRGLLDEHVQRTLVAHENTVTAAAGEVERITASLRELSNWLFAFAHAQHAQTGGAVEIPETTRRPDRMPVVRERPSPRPALPAIAPPGSAPSLPPGPGLVAAGLGPRPSSRPVPTSATRPLPPSGAAAAPRSATMIGIAPPALRQDTGNSDAGLHDERHAGADAERARVDARSSSPDASGPLPAAGPRRALGAAPTMPSMPSLARPSARPVPPIDVERRSGGQGEEGAP